MCSSDLGTYNEPAWLDRLRGFYSATSGTTYAPTLYSNGSLAEDTTSLSYFVGVVQTLATWTGGWNGYQGIFYGLVRAPGFFDVVCYTGTGSNTTQAHNLGVAPELMIIKNRNTASYSWAVYSAYVPTPSTNLLLLNYNFGGLGPEDRKSTRLNSSH